MRIGIIGAMAEEVEFLKTKLLNLEEYQEANSKFYHGKYLIHDIYLVQSGIGKVAAAVTATLLINKYQVDLLINTGSAGGIGVGLEIGDVVIADKLAYHDVDVTAFGYEPGQMAGGFPLYYEPDAKLIKLAQTLELQSGRLHTGLIVSGDQFVHSTEQIIKIKEMFADALANEMESTAIAQVAYQFKCPFLIIRAISDTADAEANIDFDEFIKVAGKKSGRFVLNLIEKLER